MSPRRQLLPRRRGLQAVWNPVIRAVEIFWGAADQTLREAVKPYDRIRATQLATLTRPGEINARRPRYRDLGAIRSEC